MNPASMRKADPPFRARRSHDHKAVTALGSAPVGGWPAGLVGRRDAALVALVCVAGLSGDQVRRSQTGDEGLVAELPVGGAGTCPRCAFTRWLRARRAVDIAGWRWRAVRAEREDVGAELAGMALDHDCAASLPALVEDGPLFVAIDHRGQVETRAALSRRAVSAIVSSCLAVARTEVLPSSVPCAPSLGPAERAAQLRRLDELCTVMEQAEEMALCCSMHVEHPARS